MSPNVNVRNLPGFGIPEYDRVELTYVGSTNNLSTVVYKRSTTTVATLTFTYTPAQPPTANDALLLNVTKS